MNQLFILLLVSVLDNPDMQQSSQTVSPTLDTSILIGISVVAGAVFSSLVLAISIILYIRHQKEQILKHGHQLFLKHFVTPQVRLRVSDIWYLVAGRRL